MKIDGEVHGTHFKQSSGVPQGDPLSPLMFLILAEGFTRLLNNPDHGPEGITIRGRTYRTSMYADDTTILLRNQQGMTKLNACLKLYSAATGMRINEAKTEGLPMGNLRHSTDLPPGIAWKKEGEYMVILGAPIGNAYSEEEYWMTKHIKCLAKLAGWRGIWLQSFQQRINTESTLLLSLYWYTAQHTPMTPELTTLITNETDELIWGRIPEFTKPDDGKTAAGAMPRRRRRHWLAQLAMYAPKRKGGAGRARIPAQSRAIQINWVMRYLDATRGDWKSILDHWISPNIASNNQSRRDAVLNKANRDQLIKKLPERLHYWKQALTAFGKLNIVRIPTHTQAPNKLARPLFWADDRWNTDTEKQNKPRITRKQREVWEERAKVVRVRDLWSHKKGDWKEPDTHMKRANKGKRKYIPRTYRSKLWEKHAWDLCNKTVDQHTADAIKTDHRYRKERIRPGLVLELSGEADPLEDRNKKYGIVADEWMGNYWKVKRLKVAPNGEFKETGKSMPLKRSKKRETPRARPVVITKSKQGVIKIRGPAEEIFPPIGGWGIEDKKATRGKKLTLPEGRMSANTIAKHLSRNGWKAEYKLKGADGTPGTSTRLKATHPPWKLPNGPKSWTAKGFGRGIKLATILRTIARSKLLHSKQTLPKYKLINRAVWTRTSWGATSATREEKQCRLCGKHEETQEHLTKCTEIAPVWKSFYDLVGDTTGKPVSPTPNHILFGLDHELKPLKGALMDLHALCWKMIIWKFTAQELDPEKPPFHALSVYKLAVQAMAVALKAHQQRMKRTVAKCNIDTTAIATDTIGQAYPFAAEMRRGKLVLHEQFTLTLAALDITALEGNPHTNYIPPPPPARKRTNQRGTKRAQPETPHTSQAPQKRGTTARTPTDQSEADTGRAKAREHRHKYATLERKKRGTTKR